MRIFGLGSLFLAAALTVAIPSADAQYARGIVTGRVVDTNGGVLQGASVDL